MIKDFFVQIKKTVLIKSKGKNQERQYTNSTKQRTTNEFSQ